MTTTTSSIPEGWTPPAWIAPFTKAELQYLAHKLHDRNTALQIENRKLRTQHTQENAA